MTLTVAIIGGGIGGLTAAIALRQHPDIHVEVYERAAEFREVGALIGLAPNGARTLEKLGVTSVLSDAIGWRNPSGVPTQAKHWRGGDVLVQNHYDNVPDKKHRFARMRRVDLHGELLKQLPTSILHTGKNLTAIKTDGSDDGKVIALFQDGTSVLADLIVGADGIRSAVRQSFVPEHKLSDEGDSMFRATFPYSVVEDIPDLDQESTRWQGPTSWFFASRLGEKEYGVTFNLNAGHPNIVPNADVVWNQPASVADFADAFANYHHPIPAIISRIPPGSLRRYTNASGPKLDHWTFGDGRIVLLGDAAHTHGGAFGAGASLAIDDAYTLYLSLRAVFAEALPIASTSADAPILREHVKIATDLYESVRRPHAARVLDTVFKERGEHVERVKKLTAAGVEEDDATFRNRLQSRAWVGWLHEHDADFAFRTAIRTKFGVAGEKPEVEDGES